MLRWTTIIAFLFLLIQTYSTADEGNNLQQVLAYLDKTKKTKTYFKDITDLVSIKSISSKPAHEPDVLKAANWLKSRLKSAGLQDIQLLYPSDEGRRPAVYASFTSAATSKGKKPTALIYGHYDVQPAEISDGWDSDPFKVVVKNGSIYGRGASDNKGGLLAAIQAIEAHIKSTKTLPINIKLLLEGEEEIGSPFLENLLTTHKELLQADFALSADGEQLSTTHAILVLGLRGQVALELEVKTMNRDVHSGAFGGIVQNAGTALIHLLSTLHDPETNQVAVQGFYDKVHPMTPLDKDDVLQFNYDDEKEVVQGLGALEPFGESNYSTLERLWFRPTLEILGMEAGYTGLGIRTAIPSKATAKLSARLVPGQEPAEVLELIEAHVARHHPPACNVTLIEGQFKARAYTMERDSKVNRAAARVLEQVVVEMGKPPLFARRGATIPALDAMQRHLGIDTTLFAFAVPGDAAHGPNERYLVSQYDRAREAWARLFFELAEEFGVDERENHSDKSEL